MDGGAWWAAVHWVARSQTRLNDFTFTFHFPALEKEMATHSSILAWRIPGTEEPGRLPSVGWHRVGHNWSDLAAAVKVIYYGVQITSNLWSLRNNSHICLNILPSIPCSTHSTKSKCICSNTEHRSGFEFLPKSLSFPQWYSVPCKATCLKI